MTEKEREKEKERKSKRERERERERVKGAERERGGGRRRNAAVPPWVQTLSTETDAIDSEMKTRKCKVQTRL